MTIIDYLKKILTTVGNDIAAVANRLANLEIDLGHISDDASFEKEDPDANGIYQKTIYKRIDGSIKRIEQLIHDITLEVTGSSNFSIYNKLITTIYDNTGVNPVAVYNHQLKYSDTGSIISKTLIV